MSEWIKVEHFTPDKPEIGQMAELLDIDHDAVVGKVVRFWIWLDQQADRHAVSVTKKFVDRVTFCDGFADAMLAAGWLEGESGDFVIPNYDLHNGKSSKKRALSRRRSKDYREKTSRSERDESHASGVTPSPSPSKGFEVGVGGGAGGGHAAWFAQMYRQVTARTGQLYKSPDDAQEVNGLLEALVEDRGREKVEEVFRQVHDEQRQKHQVVATLRQAHFLVAKKLEDEPQRLDSAEAMAARLRARDDAA